MLINLDTQTANLDELTALIALCASLGGRLPNDSAIADTPPIIVNTIMPPVFAGRVEREALPASETLLAQEAARVAEPEEPGEAANPAQLDKDGIPWDERIHSGTPTLTAGGTWRKKRGVNEVEYGRIHAELQTAHASPNVAGTGITNAPTAPNGSDIAMPIAPPPPVSAAPIAPPPPVPAATEGNAPATPTASPSAPTAPPIVENAQGAGRFASFADFVQAVNAIRSPNIPYQELNGYAQSLGVAGGFKDMKDQAALWDDFFALAGGQ